MAIFKHVGEYSVIIELLQDAISHGILSLEVHLDLELVVSQLNGLLRRFLHVRLLERQFDNITYIHIPRINNQVADSYANYVYIGICFINHKHITNIDFCTHVNK